MDCKYKDFLLCDYCNIVLSCTSKYRIVSKEWEDKNNEVRRKILERKSNTPIPKVF